ncbi:MAG: AAA family ATPase [Candidatus Bathyarchaeia archaeon]|jgi:predicted ATP-dependent endonuclease of OLD family
MKIEKIIIKNYRSLKNVSTLFKNIVIFIGRNNSGKSSILQAINNFYTPEANTKIDDFYNGNAEEPIEIEIEFNNFTNKEIDEFRSYIQDDKLTIKKIIHWNDETSKSVEEYYSYKKQVPEFVQIRNTIGAIEKRRAFTQLVESVTLTGLTGRASSERVVDELMEQYEKDHPEKLQVFQTKGTFLGARNVGGGILDKYTKLIFLPAVKEASEETEGNRSAIDQLLDLIVLEKIEQRVDLREFKEVVTRSIINKYSPQNLGGLEDLSKDISTVLERYSPGSEIRLNWNEPVPPEINLPTVSRTVFEDNFESDVSHKGHGLQRAIILTPLEYLTIIKAKISEEEAEEGQVPVRIDTILAIEEPELYLHPARCRYFSDILLKLAKRDQEDEQPHTQVIYTTHSPFFVGLERFDDLRVCRKIKQEEAAPTINIHSFSIDQAGARFSEVCEGRTYRDPVANFRVRSIPLMNTIMNEGFFADFIVLVEGQSDLGVLWKLQELKEKNWNKYSIAILTTGGKGGVINSKIIFDGLKIPNYLIFDKDSTYDLQNRKILKLVQSRETTLPAQKVFDEWAYNDHNLETELDRILTTEVFESIWEEIEKELDCDDDRIRKNPEMWARFTEIAYGRCLKFPHFEDIIEKIDALHKKMIV